MWSGITSHREWVCVWEGTHKRVGVGKIPEQCFAGITEQAILTSLGEETGLGTLRTYQGSCDTTHSVFLVQFWMGMDLTRIEKQKDGPGDIYSMFL